MDEIRSWSSDERRAAGAFTLVFLGWTAFIFFFCFSHFWKYLDGATSAWMAFVVAISFSVLVTRDGASGAFPAIVAKGDAAAASRMGGSVSLPDDGFLQKLWWLDYRFTSRWSPEEQWTRNMIFAMTAVMLAPLYLEITYLSSLGLNRGASALIFVLAILPAKLYLSRRICVWLWPDCTKRADENNLERYKRNNAPRS